MLTWSWGAAAVGAAFRGGAGASRAGMQDLKVRKRIDKVGAGRWGVRGRLDAARGCCARADPCRPPARPTSPAQATPLLFLAAATGQRFPTAVLAMRALSEREGSDFFQLTLTNVVVTGVAEVGVEGAAAADPVEEVSLSAGQWMVRYTGQGPAGAPGDPVCACFNVARNLQCGGCTPAPTR